MEECREYTGRYMGETQKRQWEPVQEESAWGETARAEGGIFGETMGKDGIDMERFGSFVTGRRKEKGLTQKQLAEKLYVSNKAVSKWERGQSLPDINLLEPLAEILEVTVTELLHGEKADKTPERELTEAEIQKLMRVSSELTGAEQERLKQVKRKRAAWYFIGLFLSTAEMVLLFAFRERLGLSLFDLGMDMLIVNPLILFMGVWPFFFMADKLPPVYDKVRISTYSDGIFRMDICGVSFNNRNWPHITKALRAFCFLGPVCWPVAYLPIHWLIPDFIWLFGRIFVQLAFILGGLFIPVVVQGKKYE